MSCAIFQPPTEPVGLGFLSRASLGSCQDPIPIVWVRKEPRVQPELEWSPGFICYRGSIGTEVTRTRGPWPPGETFFRRRQTLEGPAVK